MSDSHEVPRGQGVSGKWDEVDGEEATVDQEGTMDADLGALCIRYLREQLE